MFTIWSRAAQTRANCRCPKCLSSALRRARGHTTTIAGRQLQFGDVFTLFYSSIFATAAVIDGQKKKARREAWDKAIGQAKNELDAIDADQKNRLQALARPTEDSQEGPDRRRRNRDDVARAGFDARDSMVEVSEGTIRTPTQELRAVKPELEQSFVRAPALQYGSVQYLQAVIRAKAREKALRSLAACPAGLSEAKPPLSYLRQVFRQALEETYEELSALMSLRLNTPVFKIRRRFLPNTIAANDIFLWASRQYERRRELGYEDAKGINLDVLESSSQEGIEEGLERGVIRAGRPSALVWKTSRSEPLMETHQTSLEIPIAELIYDLLSATLRSEVFVTKRPSEDRRFLKQMAKIYDLLEAPTVVSPKQRPANLKELQQWLLSRGSDLQARRDKAGPLDSTLRDAALNLPSFTRVKNVEAQEALNDDLANVLIQSQDSFHVRNIRITQACFYLLTSSAPPNTHTFNLFISYFCGHRRYHFVPIILRAMIECKAKPDENTVSTLLRYYRGINDSSEFKRYLDLQKNDRGGVHKTTHHPKLEYSSDYEFAVRSEVDRPECDDRKEEDESHAREVDTSFEFQGLDIKNVPRNAEVHAALISGALHFWGIDEALSCYCEMVLEGWETSMEVLKAFLQYACIRGQISFGETVWQQIHRLRSGPDKDAYYWMLSLCLHVRVKSKFHSILQEGMGNGVLSTDLEYLLSFDVPMNYPLYSVIYRFSMEKVKYLHLPPLAQDSARRFMYQVGLVEELTESLGSKIHVLAKEVEELEPISERKALIRLVDHAMLAMDNWRLTNENLAKEIKALEQISKRKALIRLADHATLAMDNWRLTNENLAKEIKALEQISKRKALIRLADHATLAMDNWRLTNEKLAKEIKELEATSKRKALMRLVDYATLAMDSWRLTNEKLAKEIEELEEESMHSMPITTRFVDRRVKVSSEAESMDSKIQATVHYYPFTSIGEKVYNLWRKVEEWGFINYGLANRVSALETSLRGAPTVAGFLGSKLLASNRGGPRDVKAMAWRLPRSVQYIEIQAENWAFDSLELAKEISALETSVGGAPTIAGFIGSKIAVTDGEGRKLKKRRASIAETRLISWTAYTHSVAVQAGHFETTSCGAPTIAGLLASRINLSLPGKSKQCEVSRKSLNSSQKRKSIILRDVDKVLAKKGMSVDTGAVLDPTGTGPSQQIHMVRPDRRVEDVVPHHPPSDEANILGRAALPPGKLWRPIIRPGTLAIPASTHRFVRVDA